GRSERDERRAQEPQPHAVEPGRGLGGDVLLLEDRLRLQVRAPTAVLGGPVQRRVPGPGERALPLAVRRSALRRQHGGERLAGCVLAEPSAHLLAERALAGG